MSTEKNPRTYQIGDEVDAIEDCYNRGWTDGLPVVPPTVEKVSAMLKYCRLEPHQVLGDVPVRRRTLTAEQAAANAVMAGCQPDYFPVVLAAMEALFAYDSNCIHEASAATNSPGILILVNGPIRSKIDLNCTGNLLSPGYRANSTIGRAVRLILINVFEQRPNILDRGCMGSLTKHGVCFGEDEEHSPWEPFHVSRGFQAKDSTREEINDFIESLNSEQFAKVRSFFEDMPKLTKDVTWKCSKCEKTAEVKLQGIDAFFA